MATAPIRHTVATTLKTLLAAHEDLSGVQVAVGWPREPQYELVVISDAEGEIPIVHMRAGRKQRHDQFTLKVYMWAQKPGQDDSTALTRAGAMLAALDDVIADDPTCGAISGLTSAQLGPVTGPVAAAFDEGWGGYVEATVVCDSRLT